ncbi:MAG: OpgC domain-containing protein [Alphaproteobacteria bacterium]|nr:OpgC domain-containing protein [Alphaproteobacteria bacterium]
MAPPTAPPPPQAAAHQRDLRLDFFRGLGLLFIFVDHIPDNWVSYLTLANVVFCDAAEIFVFISGISAALVFGRLLVREGYVFAAAQALRRAWTLYVAHVFLFVIFTAQVSYAAQRWRNALIVEEMNVTGFLEEPGVAILKALTLQLQPMFMGILPLYIVLLAAFALLLPLLRRGLDAFLVAGGGLWFAVQLHHWNLSTYPDGEWFHNPFSWQFLFIIGVTVGMARHVRGATSSLLRPPPLVVSAVVLAACVAAKLWLTLGTFIDVVPERAADMIWRISDKTDLGVLRLVNFLALAHVVVACVDRDARWLSSPWSAPIVRCGQHSLEIFCFGIFLSVGAHALLAEYGRGRLSEAVVSLAGVVVLLAVAWFLAWSKRRERAPRRDEGDVKGLRAGGTP